MDEVDKIIFQSLRQIGCRLDNEEGDFTIADFTPELLVQSVAKCIKEIKPNLSLPLSLKSENMAQRFTVASILAEACTDCGYRSDIGYQTFLYPNPIDIRRLFMFLIEKLPKDNRQASDDIQSGHPIGIYEAMQIEIKEKISKQLKACWVPQYCRSIRNYSNLSCSSQDILFSPQLYLNIPEVKTIETTSKSDETQTKTENELEGNLQQEIQYHPPSIFQQTAKDDIDLISTVLHRNAIDYHGSNINAILRKLQLGVINQTTSDVSEQLPTAKTTIKENETTLSKEITEQEIISPKTPLEKLNDIINTLKLQNDELMANNRMTVKEINTIKTQQNTTQNEIQDLRAKLKIHERTSVVLENSEENLPKLEALVQATKERRKTFEKQWQTYREPMLENLKELQSAKQAKNIQNVLELRATIEQLEKALREKTTMHSHLGGQLKLALQNNTAAPRKEYACRIMEFIGNIRKQRNDIYKVLDDTRDLQKQLNSVSAQLQRQFNYTDDLLFQSAKHDMHAKKAYKLLATLHATCNELIEMVTQTGNLTKEVRDLEVQIDWEKMKNIAVSLEQILADIKNFENVVKSVQNEISKVENQITAG